LKDEWVEMLNFMGKGDIYQETYDGIVQLCIRCFHNNTRTRPRIRGPNTKSRNITSGSVTREEIGNLLENFKIDILGTLTIQFDVMQDKKRKEEEK
jgi:hypothetical protein